MKKRESNGVLEAKAPAKINLFLEVVGALADGYHEIRSVAVPVSLYDELSFEKTGGSVELECDLPGIPSGGENLVVRAANILREVSGVSRGVKITLKKSIPAGAGLGGGSSDAATTLLALNRLWELNMEVEELSPVAARVSADVPLFLYGSLVQLEGVGERVTPLENRLGELHFVVFVPEFGVSTQAVYNSAGVPHPSERRSLSAMVEGFRWGKMELVRRNTFNRLQEVAFEVEPRLRGVYESISAVTDLEITMSGSGSAFFSCCDSSAEQEDVAGALSETGTGSAFALRSVETEFAVL